MAARVMIIVVLLAAILRAWLLVDRSPTSVGPAPMLVRELGLIHRFQPDSMLASPVANAIGLENVQRLVFDPDALVLLCPGDDQRPGKANFDDNADGVVDNLSELGAITSDDVCLTPADHGYDSSRARLDCKVINHGAYIADLGNERNRPARLRLSGQLHGQAWERMVEER